MKSDISRQTFDPKKHYSQVIMQQGRVQLDADWNEQQAILQHRAESQAVDIIGRNGAPQQGGGFALHLLPGDRDFLITPGRMYVDGILCELAQGTTVEVPGPPGNDNVVVKHWVADDREWDVGQWVELLDNTWQGIRYFQIKSVNPEAHKLTFHTDPENPHLTNAEKDRIIALRRVMTYTSQPDYPSPPFTKGYASPKDYSTGRELDLHGQNLLLVYLDVWLRHITALDDPRMSEVALDGLDTTTRLQTVWQVKILPVALPDDLHKLIKEDADKSKGVDFKALQTQASATSSGNQSYLTLQELKRLEDEIMDRLRSYDCDYPNPEWEQLIAPPTGTLNVNTYDSTSAVASGYQGHENQLYRVEIHSGTTSGKPTFKWARNNASVVASGEINEDNPNVVTIYSTGQGGILQFDKGQYVEVVSNERELIGQPGDLIGITRVESDKLTLDAALPLGKNGNANTNVTLRLWEGKAEIDSSGNQWLPLAKSGIKIQFSNGTYNTGDYWLIPARTSTREVEWPPYQIPNTDPLPQHPQGIEHHYTRLARARWYKARSQDAPRSIGDCRRQFTTLPLVVVIDALHIMNINWNNDTTNPRRLLRSGLEITLNGEPDQDLARSMAEDALVVTLEAHIPGGAEGIFILNGDSEIRGNTISWRWNWAEKEGIVARVFKDMDRLGNRIFGNPRHFLRVRLRLKGHVIWRNVNGHPVYLDGQAFGIPGGPQSDGRPRIHLHFPSGNGVRASDFESWFYIRE